MDRSEALLIEHAGQLLEERLGFSVTVDRERSRVWDARMHLRDEGSEHELWVEAKHRVGEREIESLTAQVQNTDGRVLLVAPSLAPRTRERLRSAGINHVDLAGNVYIREPGLYVWVDADRKPLSVARFESGRSLNPFSKRASLVLRALFEQPKTSWGIRELSAETGLSVGHTSDIARTLVDRGYAGEEGDQLTLRDPVAALGDWIGAYDWTKNPRQSFLAPFDYEELVPKLGSVLGRPDISYALTLLAGADLVAPHVQHGQVHVYVPEPDIERAIEGVQQRLYGEPAPTGGNLHLMLPYYREATFYGQQRLRDMPVVSTVQLFLDLASYPLRGPEAARMLVRGPLARQLELDGPQVQALSSALG